MRWGILQKLKQTRILSHTKLVSFEAQLEHSSLKNKQTKTSPLVSCLWIFWVTRAGKETFFCLWWDCFSVLRLGTRGAGGVPQLLGHFIAHAVPSPLIKERESYLVISCALYSGKSGFLLKKNNKPFQLPSQLEWQFKCKPIRRFYANPSDGFIQTQD